MWADDRRPERVVGPAPGSAAPPYWTTAWPGGQALARYLLDRPDVVRGRRVVDLGTGSGIVALAAKLAGAERVVGVDTDPMALRVLASNALALGVSVEVLCANLHGSEGSIEGCDVVVAGDVLYEATRAERTWGWLVARASAGCLVLVADPGRGHLPPWGRRELAVYDLGRGWAAAVYQIDP
jgi:predicted nicotinamide N-methyase